MPAAPSWRFASFRLDPTTACLWQNNQLVPLPPKAVAVLAYLVAHADEVVTKETLLAAVWPETVVSEGVLKTCMSHIRRALGETARTPQYIVTVHRRGYRFCTPTPPMLVPLAPAAEAAPPRPRPARAAPAPPAGPPAAVGLVGRDAELAQLHQWWTWAHQGTRQIVCLTGEAGIGKTALVDAFVAHVAATDAVWIGQGHCLEHYGPGEAYLPLLEALSHLGRGPAGAQLCAVLRQQAPSWLLQLPALVSDADLAGLQRRARGATRERMLRELAEAVESLTAERPLVLVLEDLHWSDVSTVDWLAYLARRRAAARVLVLGTYRPTDAIAHGHPIHRVTQDLVLHGHGRELLLEYLPTEAVAVYLRQRFRAPELPAGLVGALHQRTSGNPLFLVTVVEDLLRHGVLQAGPHGVTLPEGLEAVTARLPESLRQLIERHLLQLPDAQQAVLEAASLVGQEFAAAAVAAGLAQEVGVVEALCATLARQHQFLAIQGTAEWPDGTLSGRYGFIHALYRETLYARVPAGRGVQWHQRIGTRLEAGYGAQARELAAELALHFVHGRDLPHAVQYLVYAGENAQQRSAHQEAIGHLTTSLELLTRLPETPERCQQELGIQTILGPALMATKGPGAPEVEQTYARARALGAQVGEAPQDLPTLWGLWRLSQSRGALPTARELAEQLVRVAARTGDPTHRVQAHDALGATLFQLGAYAAARCQFAQALALCDPTTQRAQALHNVAAPGVRCLVVGANALWCLGFPTQAAQRCQEALALAQELAHPYSLVVAQHFAAFLHCHRREVPAVQVQAETLLALATAQGFPLYAGYGHGWQGWARAMQGAGAAGLAEMHQGLTLVVAAGQELARPLWLVRLGEAAGHVGQVAAGRRLLAEALAAFAASGRGDLLAEAHRLQGEVWLRQLPPETAQADACFQQALALARQQQARSWELRAALSLSRLWQQQGKRAEASALLAPLYGWFTEGFDTADLQDAKTLLEELAG
jgi:predicted ATPase/DNA-binding winged helix-turn-helix (wHTH) protein